jgi:hypothetical protein
MHSTPHGNKQFGLHVVEIILGNYITPMATRKLGCIHLCVLQIRFGNYINIPQLVRKLGCLCLYVLQIKFGNCITTPWQQENWVASICMWCKSNLKTTCILAQRTRKLWKLLEKQYIFEKKVNHLKGIDLFKRLKLWWQKVSKKKWKGFKKTLRRVKKRTSIEHQNPYVWGVAKRIHKVEKKFWKGNLSLNSCTMYIILGMLVYYFTFICQVYYNMYLLIQEQRIMWPRIYHPKWKISMYLRTLETNFPT